MKAKKVAAYGILVALAIALSYLENLIPWTVAAPGVKLGLANTVTIFALYRLSFRDACAISLLRVLLVGILFGNAFSLAFSAAGAIVSLAVLTRTTPSWSVWPVGWPTTPGRSWPLGC